MKKNLCVLRIMTVVLGIFLSSTASAFTAVASGNWSSTTTWGGVVPTGTVSNQDITIPVGITVTLDQDVTFSGIINSFLVDGTLSSSSANWIDMTSGTLAGNGTVAIRTFTFGVLSSASFSGNMAVQKLTNKALALGIVSFTAVADSLLLESGSLTVNTNGNLTMGINSTIKVNNGTLALSGGILNLNNSYHTLYVGSSKTTGIELNTNTMFNMYVQLNDNNQVLTLGGNVIVNGNTDVSSGKVALNGNQLTLNGDLMMATGSSFTSTASSNMVIEGSGMFSDTLMFTTGSSINSLLINRTGASIVKLGSGLAVAGELHLTEGVLSLEGGSDLTMNTGSMIRVEKGSISVNTGSFDGTALYNVEYLGTYDAVAGVELSGSGLNDVTINYTGVTSLMLTDSTQVNGHMNFMSGTLLLNAQVLMLNGTMSQNQLSTIRGGAGTELHLNLTSVSNDTLFFDQGSNVLDKLSINTGGSGNLVLGTPLYIGAELKMTSGKLELENYDLTIMPAASVVGYNENKYIITDGDSSGMLVMNVIAGSTYVTFPVGTSSSYAPAQIQQAAGASSDYFSVSTMNTVLGNAITGVVSSDFAKMVDKTWFIHSVATTLNASIKLGWTLASEVNGFDRTNAYIMNYSGTGWDLIAPSSAAAGANNTYELSRTGITSLNPAFAVTEVGQAISINEINSEDGFVVYPNPSSTIVNIEMNNSKDLFKYELTDVSGRILSANKSGYINSFDVTALETGYYFVKATNLTTNENFVKKFIKE